MRDPRALPIPAEWVLPIGEYLAYSKAMGKRPQTIRTFDERLSQLARAVPVGPYDVEHEHLMDILATCTWAPATRRARVQTWRGFWGWSIDVGRTNVNPTIHLPRMKADRPAPTPLPYRLYLESLARAKPRTRMLLRLAGELGMRRGEVALVDTRRDLINGNSGWVLVVHGKGGVERKLPLASELAYLLRSAVPGFLFPGKVDGHLSPRRVSELAKEALPGEWTIHKLRHMFGSRSYAVSRDLAAVQELLGHASPTTTKSYVAVQDEQLRNIVEAVAVRSFSFQKESKVRGDAEIDVHIDVDQVSIEQAIELIGRLSVRLMTSASEGKRSLR